MCALHALGVGGRGTLDLVGIPGSKSSEALNGVGARGGGGAWGSSAAPAPVPVPTAGGREEGREGGGREAERSEGLCL